MDWKKEEEKLVKIFQFSNFTDAVSFVNKVASLAESVNHHPDIYIHSYKKIKILLFTHSENKITEKDYSLATGIDSIL